MLKITFDRKVENTMIDMIYNYYDITDEILCLRELQAQVDMDGTAKSEHKSHRTLVRAVTCCNPDRAAAL